MVLEVAENKAGDEVQRRRACSSKGEWGPSMAGLGQRGVGASARCRPRSGATENMRHASAGMHARELL